MDEAVDRLCRRRPDLIEATLARKRELVMTLQGRIVGAETDWLRQKYGGGGKIGQALLQDSRKWFDAIDWEAPDGAKTSTCCDITDAHEALTRRPQERK